MRVLKWLDENIESFLMTILFSIMVIVTFAQIVLRYFVGDSLSWSEEAARYCFIWLVYIGISYAVKFQRHISVEAILLLFKERGKAVFNIISNLFFLAFAIYVIVVGSELALTLLSFGQKSAALYLPMGLVYMAAPVGMVLTIIRIIQNLIIDIKRLSKGNFNLDNEKFIEDIENIDVENKVEKKNLAVLKEG